MRCLSQCGGTVDRLSGAFVPLWHWSHSPALLSTRPRQFLFTLFFSYFSLIPYSWFQEHMSLGSALLIRGLFCLWVSLFFALVVDGIVTGVSVGVLPSRQKVFIGLLMSLPRVVSSADLHLSLSAQSEQSQISAIRASYLVSSGCFCACPAQGHREAHYRRSMSLGSAWLFFTVQYFTEREENCQQCWLDFSLSWESGTCAMSQLVNKSWPSVTLPWQSLGSSLLQHLLSEIKRSTKVTAPVYQAFLWVKGQALTGVVVPKWLRFTAFNRNATRKNLVSWCADRSFQIFWCPVWDIYY